MTTEVDPQHEATLLEFVEKFAIVLADSGVPRMPARVFAYVLADDADHYTARELADGLRVSLAAISGAVRYLVQTRLLVRERRPGARSDHYVIDDNDLWASIILGRTALLDRWQEVLGEGVEALGEERAGGRRLRESQEFFRFIHADMIGAMDRWAAYRREHHLGVYPDADPSPGREANADLEANADVS